jgi:hypothetical protein
MRSETVAVAGRLEVGNLDVAAILFEGANMPP